MKILICSDWSAPTSGTRLCFWQGITVTELRFDNYNDINRCLPVCSLHINSIPFACSVQWCSSAPGISGFIILAWTPLLNGLIPLATGAKMNELWTVRLWVAQEWDWMKWEIRLVTLLHLESFLSIVPLTDASFEKVWKCGQSVTDRS